MATPETEAMGGDRAQLDTAALRARLEGADPADIRRSLALGPGEYGRLVFPVLDRVADDVEAARPTTADHLERGDVLLWVAGLLDRPLARRIEEHLAGCQACAHYVDVLRGRAARAVGTAAPLPVADATAVQGPPAAPRPAAALERPPRPRALVPAVLAAVLAVVAAVALLAGGGGSERVAARTATAPAPAPVAATPAADEAAARRRAQQRASAAAERKRAAARRKAAAERKQAAARRRAASRRRAAARRRQAAARRRAVAAATPVAPRPATVAPRRRAARKPAAKRPRSVGVSEFGQ